MLAQLQGALEAAHTLQDLHLEEAEVTITIETDSSEIPLEVLDFLNSHSVDFVFSRELQEYTTVWVFSLTL